MTINRLGHFHRHQANRILWFLAETAVVSFTLLALWPFPGFGQEKPRSAKTVKSRVAGTNLPNVQAYLPTPRNFDAEHATDIQLAEYGLPPKPDALRSQAAYKVWLDLVAAARERVIPRFKVGHMRFTPIRNFAAAPTHPPASGPTPSTSSNWSGFAISDPANPFLLGGVVSAYYTQPGVMPCLTAGPRQWSSYWVGIDGFGSPDVLQVGTSSDTDCVNGPQYYGWIEWYPDPPLLVNTDLPIVPGDSMFIVVAVVYGRYVLTIRDFTRHRSISKPMSPPRNTNLVGNSIEWVVERPTLPGGNLSNLALFTRSGWQTMLGYFQQGNLVYRPSAVPSGTSYIITMLDDFNSPLSTPTLYPGPTDDAAWFNGITIQPNH